MGAGASILNANKGSDLFLSMIPKGKSAHQLVEDQPCTHESSCAAVSFQKVSIEGAKYLWTQCCDEYGCLSKEDTWEFFHLAFMNLSLDGKVLPSETSKDYATACKSILLSDPAFQSSEMVTWTMVELVFIAVLVKLDASDKSKQFIVTVNPDGYGRQSISY